MPLQTLSAAAPQRVDRARLEPEAAQQVLRHLHPVRGAGAHVGQRREVVGKRALRGLQRRLGPRLPDAPRPRPGAAWRTVAAMPPNAKRAARTRVAVEFDRQRGADRRDVAVEALRHLVGAQLRRRVQRHVQRLDEFTGLEPVLHVVEVEIGQRQRAPALAAAQLDRRVQRHQHRRRVADRRAVRDVAAHRAGIADRQRGKAQPDLLQRRPVRRERAPRRFERGAGADAQHPVVDADALQLVDLADVDQLGQLAQLLVTQRPMSVEPASSVAVGALEARGGERRPACAARRSGRRRSRSAAPARRAALRARRPPARCRARRRAARTSVRRRRGSAGSRCSGTGCPTARRPAAGASADWPAAWCCS